MAVEYSRHLPLLPGAIGAVRALAGTVAAGGGELVAAIADRDGARPADLESAFTSASRARRSPGKARPDVYLAAAGRLSAAPTAWAGVRTPPTGCGPPSRPA